MKKFNGKPPNLNAPEIFLGTKPNKSTTHHNGFSDVKIAMSLTLLNSRVLSKCIGAKSSHGVNTLNAE